ncbi:unnamed protein product, partial [Mesorhabditis belari]
MHFTWLIFCLLISIARAALLKPSNSCLSCMRMVDGIREKLEEPDFEQECYKICVRKLNGRVPICKRIREYDALLREALQSGDSSR